MRRMGQFRCTPWTARVTARVTNGPISLKDFAGDADVQATNGPISVSGRPRQCEDSHAKRADFRGGSAKRVGAEPGSPPTPRMGPVSLHVPAGFPVQLPGGVSRARTGQLRGQHTAAKGAQDLG